LTSRKARVRKDESIRKKEFMRLRHQDNAMRRISGKKVFFEGKGFHVFEEVYEPSEDTFLLAESLKVKPDEIVLDVGTGCGILAVLSALGARQVVTVDVNPHAVRCAKLNAKSHKVSEKLDIICGDLFGPFKEGELFDLILFNAPYLPTEEDEPKDLVSRSWSGGKTGRNLIDSFLKSVSSHLKTGGRILLVQSTLSDVDRTLKELVQIGFKAGILAEQKAFFEAVTLIEASKPQEQNPSQKLFQNTSHY